MDSSMDLTRGELPPQNTESTLDQNLGDQVSQTKDSSVNLTGGELPPQNTESTLDQKAGDLDPQTKNSPLGPGDLIRSPSSVYELHSLLGSGVYGNVVLCRNLTANRMVALKVLKGPRLLRVGYHEMSLLRTMAEQGAHNHHIVHWFGSFEFSGHFCHEFEKLDISLKQLLKYSPCKRLTLMEIRPIVFQMAKALDFLKHMGIMHCDLKPDNIMMIQHVQQPLRIKIIDFGIGCTTATAKQGEKRQSLYYRAPEVLLGVPVNEGIDMWSVGCIVAEMFLGAILFLAQDEEDLMKHIVETLGQPPDSCLDQGLYTSNFYQWCQLMDQWEYKLTYLDPPRHIIKNLYDIKTSGSTEDHDRFFFVDLITSMMNVNPETRYNPSQVLEHPFIQMSHLAKRDHSYFAESLRTMYQAPGLPLNSVPSTPPIPPTMTASQGQTPKGKCEEQDSPPNKTVCQEIRDTSTPAKCRMSSQSPQVPPGSCPLTNRSTTQGHRETSSPLPAPLSSHVSSPLPSGGRRKRTHEEDLETTVIALTSPFLPDRRMGIVQENDHYQQKAVSSKKRASEEDLEKVVTGLTSPFPLKRRRSSTQGHQSVSSPQPAPMPSAVSSPLPSGSRRKGTYDEDLETTVIKLSSPFSPQTKRSLAQGHQTVSSILSGPMSSAVSSVIFSPLPSGGKRKRTHVEDTETTVIDLTSPILPKRRRNIVQSHEEHQNHQKIESSRKRVSEEDLETVVIDLTSPFPLKRRRSSTQGHQ